MKTLGEKIKSIRKLNKLNQNEFSSLIGISQGTLSELEQDKYRPSLETVMALKVKFDINVDWLLFEEVTDLRKGVYNVKLEMEEPELIITYRELNSKDRQEIQDIIKMKLSRYKENMKI